MRFCEMGSPVAWQKDCELMAQSSQSLRKSADNIGKTAGLRVRHSLRRGESDSQPKLLLLGVSTDLPAREQPYGPEKFENALSTEKNREAKAKRRV